MINVYMKIAQTTKLGPKLRYGLWVQGCTLACPGCLAANSWDQSGGRHYRIVELADEIIRDEAIEGITISGGEPFLQARALCKLLTLIKAKRDFGVIVYSGYTFAHLKQWQKTNKAVGKLISLIDMLIAGPYIAKLNNDTGILGSSNQTLINLTPRYNKEHISDYITQVRDVEIIEDEEGLKLIGVPTKQTAKSFENVLQYLENDY